MDIRGPRGEGPFTVHEVWVEEASEIDAEYYASIILDRSAKKVLTMLSTMGGMNVEEIAEKDPDALVQPPHRARTARHRRGATRSPTGAGGRRGRRHGKVAELLVKLYEAFKATDATLIEVNPLIVTGPRRASRSTRR